MKRRISRKVQLLYIGLFALVIGAMLAVHYAGTVRQLEKQMIASNLNVLGQINKRIDSLLQDIDLTILNLLRTPGSASFFERPADDTPEHYLFVSELQEQLGSMLGANFNMEAVMLYAKGSDRVLTAAGYARLADAPELVRIKQMATDERIGKWIALPESRELLLVRRYPINASPSDSSGLVAVRVHSASIAAMFDDLQFSDSYNVWLVDRQGLILAHKDAGMMYRPLEGQTSWKALEDALTHTGSGYAAHGAMGGKRYVFYAHSSYSDWKLLYAVTAQQLGAATTTLRYILIGLALFMIVLAVVATRFVNSRWFAPMETLIDRLEEIAAGRSGTSEDTRNAQQSDRLGYAALHSRIAEVFHGYTDAERRLREGRPALKLQVLFEALSGARTRFDTARPLLEQAGVRLHASRYIVMTLAYDNRSSPLTGTSDLNLYLYAACNVAEELLQPYGEAMLGAAVQTSGTQAAVIVSFPAGDQAQHTALALGYARSLKACIADVFKRTASIGLGSYAASFDEISDAYRASCRMIDYKIVVGDNALITAEALGERDRHRLLAVFDAVDSLLEAVRQAHAGRMHERLEELFDLAANSQLTKDMMVQLCLQVVLKALHATREGATEQSGEPSGNDELPGELEACETLREMRLTVEAALVRLIARMEERRSRSRTGELAEAVLRHLETHYADSTLSVNQLAESYRISPNYLSTIFKEHTGRSLVDTLSQLRVEAACRLLLETPLKLNEIAGRTGYTNVSSFLRNFKKSRGMTPTEYRAIHGGQD
ncbi:helix-turn-helix domain-containing protein [Paenibacillus sp. IB182496]|uniref:Helix-turn-helix domain-containing protein n=1 Tax=Paenibacillus sabuli TaxID=2772509 RepID=A0A927BXX6_9BACL|nr:cache domain-containing protein [Paenibacillus sabuli]MBD2847775.1 helix-turn-helix domain-containing protein [Paenibacillus sabuli]